MQFMFHYIRIFLIIHISPPNTDKIFQFLYLSLSWQYERSLCLHCVSKLRHWCSTL